jgi:hypothetical protein
MNPNWRINMSELLDERFSGIQSLQDLTKEAGSDTPVVFTTKEIEDFINFLNTVKQTVSILPDMPESDIKNEQDMIYHQLDSMYQTVINKMKSEPVV